MRADQEPLTEFVEDPAAPPGNVTAALARLLLALTEGDEAEDGDNPGSET